MKYKSLIAAVLIFAATFVSTAQAAEFEMISYSAQVKLQWLAAAGIPDAQLYLKFLEKPNFFNKDNLPDFERLEKVNAVYNEFCYASFIDFVKANGYKNVMEIGCSYSPRVVELTKAGCNYVGAELAAVAYVANELGQRVINKKYHKNFAYYNAPVADRDAMIYAGSFLGDNVCIIEQGLMIYFDRPHIQQMLENIKPVLQRHGGCYVTSNFCRKPYFNAIASTLYGADAADTLYKETYDIYETVLGDPMYDDTFQSDEDAIKFLDKLGFNVKQVPLFGGDFNLYSFKGLSADQINSLKSLGKQPYIWILTLK